MKNHCGRITPRNYKIRAAWAHLVGNGHSKTANLLRAGVATLKGMWGKGKHQLVLAGTRVSADGDLLDKSPGTDINFNGLAGKEKARLEYLPYVLKYKRAVDRNPNNAFAQFHLGVALGNSGEMEDAKKCFDEVIRLNPHVYRAYFYRAFCRYILKDRDGAKHDMTIGDIAKNRLYTPYVDPKIRKAVIRIMAESIF